MNLGINEARILLTDTVANTADEAAAVAELMNVHKIRRILLVTSSFHMPRAKLLFDKKR